MSYEEGEKSSKYFLNLEKTRAIKGTIRSIVEQDGPKLSESPEILGSNRRFYAELFSIKNTENIESCRTFLNKIEMPVLNEIDKNTCEVEITIDDLFHSLSSMKENKTPGNDGLGKEFYLKFWDKLKTQLFECIMHGKEKGELSTSQRH